MKALRTLCAALVLAMPVQAPAQDIIATIRMSFGTTVVEGVLHDTPPSRDLLARLPLSVPMQRLGMREYAGRPSPGLTTQDAAQEGFAEGDIGYWTPGGYLAVFYDASRDPGISDLVVMGRVTSPLSVFSAGMAATEDVLIERTGDRT